MNAKPLIRWLLPLLGGALFWAADAADACADVSAYPREHVYDTAVHNDEAAVNVGLASNRWPDCTTLESAIRDIFRLEGVAEGSDQQKALALWKWFRILVSATGGSYAYEGPRGKERLCHDPHKILTVYGHHQCDGMSWTMVPLWRAAGYMALDECTWGHTTAALRYVDDDGRARYHSFDPQRRYYHWDPWNRRVATRTLPVMRGMVFRHVTTPQRLHSLRTSLRIGETIERTWDNRGHVVPSGKDKLQAEQSRYYAYAPGKTTGVYAAVGEQVQTLAADCHRERFAEALYEGSCNVACSELQDGGTLLHPEKAGRTSRLIYRLAPPYVVADARCEAVMLNSRRADLCRLCLSRDGTQWTPFCVLQQPGEHRVAINIGRRARRQGLPDVYTAYGFFIKAEFRTNGDVRQVGMRGLKVVTHRMLNKRTLPNLRPGENVLRVTADRMAEGWGLELGIDYRVGQEMHSHRRFVTRFPHYFSIHVPDVPETIHENYDQRFNDGPLRMSAIRMRLRPLAEAAPTGPSLSEARGTARFAVSSPHPADMTHRKMAQRAENDLRETSGFFPQSDRVLDDEAGMHALLEQMRTGGRGEDWLAAEELGNYPKALDALLEALPGADIDQTVFLCKALAQIGDGRAIGPLLRKWRRAPRGAPGTRYIPDALAAIGDRRVVPELIARLKRCRFDFRFHIAHALGILGGPEAQRALQDLAANDPFPAVRQEAKKALAALRARSSR